MKWNTRQTSSDKDGPGPFRGSRDREKPRRRRPCVQRTGKRRDLQDFSPGHRYKRGAESRDGKAPSHRRGTNSPGRRRARDREYRGATYITPGVRRYDPNQQHGRPCFVPGEAGRIRSGHYGHDHAAPYGRCAFPGIMAVRPDIPVILCTGFSPLVDEEKAMEMGIRAFISKPILRREIAETIRRVLYDPQGTPGETDIR